MYRGSAPTQSVLLLPNHSHVVDGFFPYVLNDIVLKRKFLSPMLEHRLREFCSSASLVRSLSTNNLPKASPNRLIYTATLFHGNRLLSLPQGELTARGKRPLLQQRRGAGYTGKCIERGKQIAIIPLAIRCEFCR